MERRNLFLGAAAALVASGGSYVGSTRQSTAGPRAGYFPNAALRTHEDKSVLFYDDLIAGKFVVINFMYTGCGDICPGMTANLVEVQRLLGDRVGRDIFLYSITLQPELDTPEILRGYAETFGVRRRSPTAYRHRQIRHRDARSMGWLPGSRKPGANRQINPLVGRRERQLIEECLGDRSVTPLGDPA